MYLEIYDILQGYLYGSIELTNYMDLTLTLLSTIGCIAIVAIPFFVVYFVISAFVYKR